MDTAGDRANVGAGSEVDGRGLLCQATARDGRPCRAPCVKGERFCYFHHPAKRASVLAAAAEGGRRASGKRRALLGLIDFGSPEGVRSYLEGLCRAATTGEIASSRARDCAAIAQVAVQIRQVADLEQIGARLSVLEENLGIASEGDE